MQAGEDQLGTDESAFNMVLCAGSAAQLRATFEAYKQLADRDIEDVIRSETSGTLQDGYLAIGRLQLETSRGRHYRAGRFVKKNTSCSIRLSIICCPALLFHMETIKTAD